MRVLLLFGLALLLLEEEICARRRHGHRGYLRDDSTHEHGPNVCAVREVYGTGEQFYPECTGQSVRKICERPTFIRYQCCFGYGRKDGEVGCPSLKPLENLVETAKSLGLNEFVRLLKNTELHDDLAYQGAYTIFAPMDEAFSNISYIDRDRLYPTSYNAPSLLHYHVVHGRHNYTKLSRNEQLPTLYYGRSKLRINKYPFGVATVNCARIVTPNQVATNGIIHVIDKVMKPQDRTGSNVGDTVLRDARFSRFAQALYTAKMVTFLQNSGPYTFFAPTNAAFDRLDEGLKNRILTDQRTAEAVVKYHLVKGVYCGDAVVVSCGMKTLEGDRLTFRCRRHGHYVNDARVTHPDIVSANGVVHAINKVLIPDSVKDMLQFARDMNLNKLVEYTTNAGLEDRLKNRRDFTLFAPTDEAFEALSPEYQSALRQHPNMVERLLDYHTVNGKVKSDSLVGNLALKTGLSARIKINVFRSGIAVDNANIEKSDNECGAGVIHTINKVLEPPGVDLMTLIAEDQELSTFKTAVESAQLTGLLSRDGHYTVLAPTNDAFNLMNTRTLDYFFSKPVILGLFVERHIVNGIVVECGITRNTVYSVDSREREPVSFRKDDSGVIYIQNHIRVLDTTMATNGVLFKIDRAMQCLCRVIKKEL